MYTDPFFWNTCVYMLHQFITVTSIIIFVSSCRVSKNSNLSLSLLKERFFFSREELYRKRIELQSSSRSICSRIQGIIFRDVMRETRERERQNRITVNHFDRERACCGFAQLSIIIIHDISHSFSTGEHAPF